MSKQSKLLNYLEPRLKYNEGTHYSLAVFRKKVLARDTATCQNCYDNVQDLYRQRKNVSEAHHIVARRHGGRNTLNNGITLCNWCHDYFDYLYWRVGEDFYQVLQKKSRGQRIREVRRLIKKRFMHSLAGPWVVEE